MKLNLLPKTVDTSGRAKFALVGGVLVFVGSLLASFAMAKISGDRLAYATEKLNEIKPKYEAVVKVATEADTMMAAPQVKQAVVNTGLAKSMLASSRLYPDFYDGVKSYIPAFFRITQMSATPIDDKSSSLRLTGTVKNAQEYADLMLGLLRIPGATSVTRAGFQAEDVVVPALTEIDQVGKRRKESEAPIPDDAFDRLQYFTAQSVPAGYLNSGNFGVTEPGTVKTVRPGESLISVVVTVPKDLRVPNPRGTIQSLGGAATSATAAGAKVPAAGQAPVAPGGQD
ncbi:MAG: hypothetical protein WCK51_00020 [Armatimonadota bacterium]